MDIGQHRTGHEPFEIPVLGARQGLVKVVGAEHQRALRGGLDADVHQVDIPAALDHHPPDGAPGEVDDHLGHAPMADRQQPWQAMGFLIPQHGDGSGALAGSGADLRS